MVLLIQQPELLSLTGTTTINNIALEIANEGNLSIVSQTISKVMNGGGLSLYCGYPTVTRQSISASTAHSYQLSITRAYGQRILALITAPFSSATAVNFRNVHIRGDINYL
jgi:hypothetical protein